MLEANRTVPMSENTQDSQEFYNDYFSEDWKLTYDNEQRYEIIFQLIDNLPLSSNSRVIDIGAGSGRITNHLHSAFDEVVSLDITMNDLLEKVIEETDTACAIGALPHLPFADGTFDLIVCSEVLEHIPDRETQYACVNSFECVLSKGGYAVISTPNPRSPYPILKNGVQSVATRFGLSEQSGEGQLVENWIPPSHLHEEIKKHFDIRVRCGSYYNFPDFGTGAGKIFRPLSDLLTDLNIVPSYGLYQYYVGQAN